jgi:hypothetical protein
LRRCVVCEVFCRCGGNCQQRWRHRAHVTGRTCPAGRMLHVWALRARRIVVGYIGTALPPRIHLGDRRLHPGMAVSMRRLRGSTRHRGMRHRARKRDRASNTPHGQRHDQEP